METSVRKSLRLWPGIALAAVVVLLRFVIPLLAPEAEVFEMPVGLIGIFAGILGGLATAIWWLFFSRARWSERVAAIGLAVVGVYLTRFVIHESIRGGHMGMMQFLYSIPVIAVALVVWAAASQRFSDTARRVSLVIAIFLACGVFALIRTDGVMGSGSQITWRWTPTHEDRLLARGEDEPSSPPSPAPAQAPPPQEPPAVVAEAPRPQPAVPAEPNAEPSKPVPVRVPEPPAWPGFRGPARDGIIRGIRIDPDWSSSPPVAVWRRPIGPGWSSFAVEGDLLYTQEQRGEEEIVSCYRVTSGEPVWRHRDPVRFWESNAGAGPRGTPTLSNGRVYALGATGILNALDAGTGRLVWSRNVSADAGRRVPDWGFASSPLVVDDTVIVAASGTLIGYAVATGTPRWVGPRRLGSYSSPHLMTIDGVAQVLLLTGSGATSVAPADGAVLWEHEWPGGGTTIVQPALTAEGDVLINTIVATGGMGVRRIAIDRGPDGWKVEERWTSHGLKPYFNDFIVHDGHAYGFDGAILACIELETGTRKWKGGRYGSGQLVLLREQDLLLVISEDGELALVGARPDQYREIARTAALEGKTWNHPAIVGNILLVRNGEEMAAYRLSVRRSPGETAR